MPIELGDKAGLIVGVYSSVDEAKAAVREVVEWRPDENRELGWNGWLAPQPFTEPDFRITHVSGGKGGAVRIDGGGRVRESPFTA